MITKEEKDAYLVLVSQGHDSATAARMVNPEYTGSMFRRLTNESSTHYDPEFTTAFLRAYAEGTGERDRHRHREARGEARVTTLSGHVKAMYLSEEMLEGFLEEIAEGVPFIRAVSHIQPKTSATQITRRANRDPEFARRFAEAKEQGYPIFQENLKHQAMLQAEAGDYRALKDLLIIHVPEYRQLLATTRHEINATISAPDVRELIDKVFPGLSLPVIDALITDIEQRQLPPGDDENSARAA